MSAQQAFDDKDADGPDHIVFSPRRLGHLVSDLLVQGRPGELLHLDPL
jgi:hypothetical protein